MSLAQERQRQRLIRLLQQSKECSITFHPTNLKRHFKCPILLGLLQQPGRFLFCKSIVKIKAVLIKVYYKYIYIYKIKPKNMVKKILMLLLATLMCPALYAIPDTSRVALLVIDIQDFYFPGGKSELVNPLPAAKNAALLVEYFRSHQLPVIYVKHQSAEQEEINEMVKPLADEPIFTKTEVNCFVGTQLYDYLVGQQISKLVICGMQTHLCVEAAVRAASDYGFKVTLIHDACATRDVKWGNTTIPANMVHLSTLSTLQNYARILSTEECLKANP